MYLCDHFLVSWFLIKLDVIDHGCFFSFHHFISKDPSQSLGHKSSINVFWKHESMNECSKRCLVDKWVCCSLLLELEHFAEWKRNKDTNSRKVLVKWILVEQNSYILFLNCKYICLYTKCFLRGDRIKMFENNLQKTVGKEVLRAYFFIIWPFKLLLGGRRHIGRKEGRKIRLKAITKSEHCLSWILGLILDILGWNFRHFGEICHFLNHNFFLF